MKRNTQQIHINFE